ncbi:MAG: tandem-95 repeat protein [Kofleriaceae bacterium]|nr:tandem-95 repeat protein [Kofleriaceae bacterium]
MRTLALLWSTLALLTACGDDLQPAPPPTIADATLTTAEDTPASVALVASDVLGRALTYQASAPAHGTVSLTGASLSFTPEADYHGPDQVTVSVGVDGDDARSSAVVTITVTPVNDAPVAGADALAADEDTAAEVATAALLGNDTDVDGDSLTVTAVGPVDQGAGTVSLSSDGLGLTFTPAADFTGAATFPYTVSDGAASATATVTVTVGGRNDAPVAGADSLTTAEDVELVVLPAVLLGNDTDPDGQALSVSAVGPVTGGGTVSLSGGMVRFVPARDFAGVVTFPYTLTDGADTATGVVTVTVTAVDDAPVAGDDSTSTLEDTPLVLGVFALLGNDTDLDGPTLGVSAVGPATGGTVALTGTTITFTPSPDSSGPAGFDYTISDGTLTDTGRVNVLVVAANDRPVAGDDSATVPGDTTLTLAAADLLGNDTDVDGPALRVSAVGPATDGVVALAGTTITFTPALGFVGIAGFDYQVSDGDLTDTGHVTVVVTDVDTTPIAVDDGPVSTTEDNAVIIPVLGNDGGLGDPPLVVTIVTPPGAGSAIVLPDLTVRYQPAAEASGTDTFSYEVRDVDGQASTALVTVEVSPVDDPPTVADQSLPSADGAGVLVTLVAADVDSASVTFAVATGPSHGTLGAVTPTGPLTATVGYTPSAGYVGVDTFTVTAADASSSSAPATITLTMTMSAPTVSATTPADGASAVDPLAPLALTFSLAMDPTSLTVQGAAGPCSGAIQLSADDFASCLGLGSAAAMSAGDTVATVTPAPALAHGTSYKLRVTGAALTATGTAMAATFTQATGFSTRTSAPCATDLVISQIYAGGGNSGALFNNDFIELHNPTPAPIDLTGYAVQFTSATGTTWAAQALPAVSLPAGGYYLIQEAAGTGTPGPLPTPDFVPAPPFAMGAASGKVALTRTTVALAGACPTSAAIVDLVGYGVTASCFAGAGPTPAPSNSTAVHRGGGGCTDAGSDATDFATAPPAPRTGASAPLVCACAVNESGLGVELDYCNLQHPPSTTAVAGSLTELLFGRVYDDGVTQPAGPSTLRAELGLGPPTVNPQNQAGFVWTAAAFNLQVGNDDEYQAQLAAPLASGTYRYAARFSPDGVNWTYCDLDGAGAGPGLAFDPARLGTLTVP